VETPCGVLEVAGQGDVISALQWHLEHPLPDSISAVVEIQIQLSRYFADPHHDFDFRLAMRGTVFFRRVWQRLLDIPVGRVMTYGQLAAGLATSPRAVASACRANPYPVIVPCHRVVAKSGLGGYCGQIHGPMLAIKRWLLKHEGYHG